ncbi:MAG: hypothetical protein DWQ20_00710 [Actinobacteria bacterium]|nr:MAG: hypothetical protein DWQ20_00710 [Actinomycetota bacterium]
MRLLIGLLVGFAAGAASGAVFVFAWATSNTPRTPPAVWTPTPMSTLVGVTDGEDDDLSDLVFPPRRPLEPDEAVRGYDEFDNETVIRTRIPAAGEYEMTISAYESGDVPYLDRPQFVFLTVSAVNTTPSDLIFIADGKRIRPSLFKASENITVWCLGTRDLISIVNADEIRGRIDHIHTFSLTGWEKDEMAKFASYLAP